jgi:signal peptidase II
MLKQKFYFRLKHWVLLALVVVVLDQISKCFSLIYLSPQTPLPVLPSFDLVLRYNTGAAFSFLADASGWQRWFFVGLAIVASAVIFKWLGKLSPKEKLESFALSLILGGALGNMMDRVTNGYVVDFILLYYRHWQWPAFNLADSAICLGVFLLIPTLFRTTASSN